MRFPTAQWSQVWRVVGQQLSHLPGARRSFFLALALLTLGAAANIMIPLQLGKIVDEVIAAGEPAQGLFAALGSIAGGLIAAAVAAAAFSAAGFYVLSRMTERIIANLREEMVGTALSLPAHRVEEAGSGDLVSRSTDDVAELSSAVTETVPVLASSAFAIVTTAVALVAMDWRFLLVVACAVPVYALAARNYLKAAPQRYANERAAMADRARRVLEAIRGRHTVRAYRMEPLMHERIREASSTVVKHGYHARRTMMVLQLWLTTVELLMLSTGLIIGYLVVQSGALSVGAVTAAMLMLIRLRGPLMGLMRVLDTIQSGYASLARIVGVVADPPLPTPASGAPAPGGRARMDDVSFRYDDKGWAVKDLSLDINPGQTVALVGASGAGKTTVAALLAGMRVPDSGEVTVDGVRVSALSDAERIARLAMISQDVYVFSGTLREDLALARPGASDEEMIDALQRVGAGWFEELADGLDTVVGARGLQLEPVEAQQLALARILLLDPKIVVMDEATAEAGSVGAGALEGAAQAVTSGRSALVVAHRLDQAARADRVLVMEDGQVVEEGTHSQLLDYGGRYCELWAAWQKGRE
ncbi:ABC transporter ATP-binding protein [Corynebacterium flavescens]|uniref:ABC transporter ATP-binding protein n=1 Tax=Corynebacterium flavescens TaxID=28028 RepID=UPI003FD1A1F1